MNKSESIKNIAIALGSFQSELPIISLDREVEVTMKSGGKYKFSYATMKHIVEAVKPLLSKHKLSYSQLLEPDGTVITLLMHESGEFLSSSLLIKGESNAQGIGSAITYAKRYSLSSILGVIADDDDDGNIAEGQKFETRPEDTRPWMTEKDLNVVLAQLKSGKKDSYNKADKAFRMKKEYRALLKENAAYSVVTEPSDINDEFLTSWVEELNKVKSSSDLVTLYKSNRATVDNDQRIKEMFKAKENKLKTA